MCATVLLSICCSFSGVGNMEQMKKQNCSTGLPKITCKSSFFFFGGGLRIFLQPPNTHSGVNLAGFLGYAGEHPEGLVGSEGLAVGRMENFEVLT